jgi:stress response protein YsnF
MPRSFAEQQARRYAKAKYTYDPSKEGYGDADQWAAAFEHVMGFDEATKRMKQDSPLSIMGFAQMPTLKELKVRYRQLMLQHQECLRANATEEQQTKVKLIIAAYTILEKRLNP